MMARHCLLSGAFFCLNMVLITLSSFLSAIIINLYMRVDKKNKVPDWLRVVCCLLSVLRRTLGQLVIINGGLVFGRRPLGAILHSSNKPGELSQWLCHDDSTINIVVLIIIIIIIIIIMVDVDYISRTHSTSRLAWSEGRHAAARRCSINIFITLRLRDR